MNVLILEDDVERCKLFRANLVGLDICIEDNAKDLINQLYRKKWDVLFLDHDLGGEIFVSSEEENSGSGVARFLNSNPQAKPDIIIIHSLNNDGSTYMKKLISEAYYLPFAWQIITSEHLTNSENIKLLKHAAETQSIRMEQYGRF